MRKTTPCSSLTLRSQCSLGASSGKVSLIVVFGGVLVRGSLTIVLALLPSITDATETGSQSSIGWNIRVIRDARDEISKGRETRERVASYLLLVSFETAAECALVLELRNLPPEPKKPMVFVVVRLVV